MTLLSRLFTIVFTFALLFTIHSSLFANRVHAEPLTICKVILNESGAITNGSEVPGVTFTLPGLIPNPQTSEGAPWGLLPETSFTTPLTLNTALPGSQSNNAQCFTYDLTPGCDSENGGCGYYYDQEIISGSNIVWEPPRYNDGFNNSTSLGNANVYSNELFTPGADEDNRNRYADGHVIVNEPNSEERSSGFIIIVNQIGEQLPSPSPNIKACQNPLYTDQLTKVVLEPLERTFTETGTTGTPVTLTTGDEPFEIHVNFEKLAAIFAPPNSNYLESRFQDVSHRQLDITSLSSQDFNSYHGPGQKAAPLVMTDQLRVSYVEYVNQKSPELAESDNTYTEIDGTGDDKTISELVAEFGLPNPPSLGGDQETWLATWGRYWPKIPTAVNEFYWAKLTWPMAIGNEEIEAVENGSCPWPPRTIYFVMPEYYRTTSIANQLNQIVVPIAAQSSSAQFVDNNLFAALENTKMFFGNIIETIQKNLIKKISSITNPIKNVYAAVQPPDPALFQPVEQCPQPIPIQLNDLEGAGPFCSLPEFSPGGSTQLRAGETCDDSDSPYQLDTGILVDCTFLQEFTGTYVINGPGWDCEESGIDPITLQPLYTCTLTVKVYPTFYIPWLAPIWNNTTFSDEADEIAIFGAGKTGKDGQETGRPGLFGLFTPKAVESNVFPQGKNLPSEEQGGDEDIRQRFFGAVDCNKDFARDISLKPKALQEFLGIVAGC